jgi:spore germination protein YaaH
MVARNRARYLAPIALAATIAGTYVIVHNTLTAKQTTSHSQAAGRPRVHGRFARAKFYAIRPGDSLTAIAIRTGIPLTTLEALNPSVDPNALQTGQRLRLRR